MIRFNFSYFIRLIPNLFIILSILITLITYFLILISNLLLFKIFSFNKIKFIFIFQPC
jgi:hypothetical protein